MRDIGDKVLAGETEAFDIDKLRPAIFTLLAVEEPENSLSPHYLGRVVRAVSEFAKGQNTQALVATHAPRFCDALRLKPSAIFGSTPIVARWLRPSSFPKTRMPPNMFAKASRPFPSCISPGS
jgi:hypothetical protein